MAPGPPIRNGPGSLEFDGERATHWFDGLAMLLRCGFDDGEGRYTSRFLRTDADEDARSSGTAGEFATRTNGLVGTPRAC